MPEFKKVSTQGIFTQHQSRLRQSDRDLMQLLEEVFTNLSNLFNRGLGFTDNFDAQEVTATAHVTPDTEFSVAHTLGRVPTRFIVTDIDEGGVVYKGTTAWTSGLIYLKCTTGGTAIKVLLY